MEQLMEHSLPIDSPYRGEYMRRNLRMKCPSCGYWNSIPVNKLFVEQRSPEPKVKVVIPVYEPLQVSKCKKCGKVIAGPKELVRIVKSD